MSNALSIPPRKNLPNHLLGIIPAYILTTYFSTIHDGFVPFLLISLTFQILCGIFIRVFLSEDPPKMDWRNQRASILTLITAAALPLSAAVISWQFPSLFDRRLLFMDASRFPVFLGLLLISTPLSLWVNHALGRSGVFHATDSAGLIQFLQKNRAGFMAALLFFLAYFIFAQTLNFPGHYTRDQYFETDISDWILRLTAHPTDEQFPVRAVHPAVLLFLRPLVWLLSIPLNGDRLQAAFLLSALAGAACVFMTWMIVRQRSGSTAYALISASILGASTSHLLLGSMLETYIFSALALISFCFLIQDGRTSLKQAVPMGVVIFGITISNLAQACILYFFKVLRIRTILTFVALVVAITLALHLVQTRLYPNSRLMTASSLARERTYSFDPFGPAWQTVGRVNLTARAIFLYGILAPQPFVLSEEIGANTPNFRTYRKGVAALYVAGYRGLADIAVKSWFLVLSLAFILFLAGMFKSPRRMTFHLSLLSCLGFNLVLHILYGDDPMLYSPNWVYALVLFVASTYEKWADNGWLQAGSIAFLALMIYTNLGLIHRIMSVSASFHGG